MYYLYMLAAVVALTHNFVYWLVFRVCFPRDNRRHARGSRPTFSHAIRARRLRDCEPAGDLVARKCVINTACVPGASKYMVGSGAWFIYRA